MHNKFLMLYFNINLHSENLNTYVNVSKSADVLRENILGAGFLRHRRLLLPIHLERSRAPARAEFCESREERGAHSGSLASQHEIRNPKNDGRSEDLIDDVLFCFSSLRAAAATDRQQIEDPSCEDPQRYDHMM